MSYGGRRFGGGGFGGPKPVETGKEYDVQVTEISRKGDGIARIQGFVIFVSGARVGQKSKVRITNVGERFATAELIGGQEAKEPEKPAEGGQEMAPQTPEQEKAELQDYKSEERPAESGS